MMPDSNNGGAPSLFQYPNAASTANPVPFAQLQALCGEHLSIDLDVDRKAFWFFFHPAPVPCFNPGVLKEILAVQAALKAARCQIAVHPDHVVGVRWVVVGSRVPGVFNLGGDLALFLDLIKAQDWQALSKYATDCIDTIFNHVEGYGAGVGTISLVQGRALGGGFECALASGTIIAEEQAVLGLPEILFNLFPGMGAANMLARRVSGHRTDAMITAGGQWSARQLFDWGVINRVVEDGDGVRAANDWIDRYGEQGILHQRMKRLHIPLTYGELVGSITEWSTAAMGISSRDQKLIKRLRRAQGSLGSAEESAAEGSEGSSIP
jgi:DSF synthase